MKLQSTTDFLLHLRGMTTSEICRAYPRRFREPVWKGDKDEMVKDMLALDAAKWDVVGEYAKLMKQPLELWMFLPCDKEGDVLEKPNDLTFELYKNGHTASSWIIEDWKKAQERMLFHGFKYCIINKEDGIRDENHTPLSISELQKMKIENISHWNIEVTDSFIKKLRL